MPDLDLDFNEARTLPFVKVFSGGPVAAMIIFCQSFSWGTSVSDQNFKKLFSGGPVSCLTWTPNKKRQRPRFKREARTLPFKKPFNKQRTTCLTDKTNHPVKGLSLNRSQYGSCSTKYNTPAGT